MDEEIMYKRSQGLRDHVGSFHLFTMFIGLGVTAIGAYLFNSNISRTISILLLIVGIIITTTSFIGCLGAHLEHTDFINTWSSITAIALLIELVVIGLFYSHKLQLDEFGSIVWDFFIDNDPQFLLDIEESIKCCGYASIGDRPIPKTCSILLGETVKTGCRESIISNIRNNHKFITIAIIFLLSTQSIVLLVSVILSYIMDREEAHMSLLTRTSSSHHHQPLLLNNNNSSSSNNNNAAYFHRSSQKSIPKYGSTPSR